MSLGKKRGPQRSLFEDLACEKKDGDKGKFMRDSRSMGQTGGNYLGYGISGIATV